MSKPFKNILITLMNVEYYYLPPLEDCPLSHIFAVMQGKKKALKTTELIPYPMPNYKEFRIDRIMEQVATDPEVMAYIPELGEKQVQNRTYVVTTLSSLRPEFVR